MAKRIVRRRAGPMMRKTPLTKRMMQARCRVIYSVEHAGVKTFRLRAPQPGVAQRPCDDLGAPIVPVQARLAHDDPDVHDTTRTHMTGAVITCLTVGLPTQTATHHFRQH